MVQNKLLLRQIKKAGINLSIAPDKASFEKLLKLIEQSYEDTIKSRRMIEHSLDVSSAEMRETIDALEHANEEVAKKDKMMFQQSRFAQMGEMISMIAHQWRQPLNLISATTASIEFDVYFNKLEREKLLANTQNIARYSQHLSDTIDDFRNFFKIDKEMQVTTFMQQVSSVLSIIGESLYAKKIDIIEEFNYTQAFQTYTNELKHVIINLIKNAEDALLENNIRDPFIKIKSYTQDDTAILEISDNGGGIPENIIEDIFDPYFSTKSKKSGTGLGLYMSKIIIQEHCKGVLEVRNYEDGCIFTLKLPL
jgi:signal transduction histidine kinase